MADGPYIGLREPDELVPGLQMNAEAHLKAVMQAFVRFSEARNLSPDALRDDMAVFLEGARQAVLSDGQYGKVSAGYFSAAVDRAQKAMGYGERS